MAMEHFSLSMRAINGLKNQGYDLRDPERVRAQIRELVQSGVGLRWRNVGHKTTRELVRWASDRKTAATDALLEYGAIKLLEARGYKVTRPYDSSNRSSTGSGAAP